MEEKRKKDTHILNWWSCMYQMYVWASEANQNHSLMTGNEIESEFESNPFWKEITKYWSCRIASKDMFLILIVV